MEIVKLLLITNPSYWWWLPSLI